MKVAVKFLFSVTEKRSVQVKVILAVMKQLKQFQRKSRNSEASTGKHVVFSTKAGVFSNGY